MKYATSQNHPQWLQLAKATHKHPKSAKILYETFSTVKRHYQELRSLFKTY